MRLTAFALLAAASTALAQDEELARLPVGDLLARPGARLRGAEPVSTCPRDEEVRRVVAGEAALLGTARGSEGEHELGLDAERITNAVNALLETDARRVEFDETTESLVFPATIRARVEAALAALRAAAPATVSFRAALERLDPDGDVETLLCADGNARPGEAIVLADAVNHNVIADYGVEIAQAASIGDPILRVLRTGTSLALRVRPLPAGADAVVEVVARSARRLDEPAIDLGNPSFGPMDRCAVALDETGTSFRAGNAAPAEITWTGREGRRLRLRLEVAWTPVPAPGPRPVLASAVLGSSVVGFRHARRTGAAAEEVPNGWDEGVERAVSGDALVASAVRDPIDAALVSVRRGVLVVNPEVSGGAASVARSLCAALDDTLRPVHVEALVVNVPAGARVALGAPLPAGARVVAGADAPVLRDLPACFTGGTERSFIADWEVEVAQSARIADPVHSSFATGHYLTVTVRGSAIDMDLDLLRLDALPAERIDLGVGRRSFGAAGDTAGSNAEPSLPPETANVERPEIAELRISETLPLDRDGTATIRRSAASFLGQGRELVVIVRAR